MNPSYLLCLFINYIFASSAFAFDIQSVDVRHGMDDWYAPSIDSLPPGACVDLGNATGAWRVSAVAGPGVSNCSTPSLPASVPGDIYTDLHQAGIIKDPLAAFGDWKTAWVGRTSWSYQREFDVTVAQLTSSGSVLLVAEGLETNATVYINGQVRIQTDKIFVALCLSSLPFDCESDNTVVPTIVVTCPPPNTSLPL